MARKGSTLVLVSGGRWGGAGLRSSGAGEAAPCDVPIADGRLNCAPMITGTVGLGGVDAAFSALGDPERHAKILIDPASPVTAPG